VDGREEGKMELALILMLGFLLLGVRSKEDRRADVQLVEVLLAAVFLLFVFGSSAG
jgi:hypothetical protein